METFNFPVEHQGQRYCCYRQYFRDALSVLRMQYSFYVDIRILFVIRFLQVTCIGLQTQDHALDYLDRCVTAYSTDW